MGGGRLNLGARGIWGRVVRLGSGSGKGDGRRGGAERRNNAIGFVVSDGEIFIFIGVESLEVGVGGGEVVEEEGEDGEKGDEEEESVAPGEEQRERGDEEGRGRFLRHC